MGYVGEKSSARAVRVAVDVSSVVRSTWVEHGMGD